LQAIIVHEIRLPRSGMLLMITQSSSSLVLSHGASVTSGARAAGTARVRLACWLRRLLAAGGAAPWIPAAGSKDTEAGTRRRGG